MKSISFSRSNRVVEIHTNDRVLDALLADQVPVGMACKGNGLCATCHVYVERGRDQLTPRTKREERTLSLIGEADVSSRLACQARVLGDVVVRLPDGLYVERTEDLMSLIGRRAEQRLLHPVTGRVLVPEGKIITRSMLLKLTDVQVDVDRLLATSHQVQG